MSNVIFNPPAGLSWSIKKRPRYGTIVQDTTSGRGQIRMAKQQYPIWEYEMNWNYLTGAEQAALGANSGLEQMMGFFMARQGRFDDFLYTDPNDNLVTAMPFGVGDGSMTAFQLQRNIGGGVDIVQNVNQSISPPKIYKYDWQGTKNLALQSESIISTPWAGGSGNGYPVPICIANAAFAPDGSNNAAKISFPSVIFGINNYSAWSQTVSTLYGSDRAGRTYTFSIWLRADVPVSNLVLQIGDAAGAIVINVTTQWQRFSVTRTYAVGDTGTSTNILLLNGQNSAFTLYAWGAQFEESASATAYQKTGANNFGPTLQYSAARTNKFIWTQSIENAVWTKTFNGSASAPTVTVDAVVAPDGTTTADSVAYSATGGSGSFSDLYQNILSGAGPGTTWTFSIWLKAASNTTISLIVADSNPFTGNGIITNVVNVSTKWQRFVISTSFTAGAGPGVACSIRNEQSQPAKTIHVWGAQLESGLVATSYIGATNSIVTVTDYTLGPSGIMTFASPPANNALVTWDGSYYYRLHFAEDGNDFEEFMYQLWELRSVKLESVII